MFVISGTPGFSFTANLITTHISTAIARNKFIALIYPTNYQYSPLKKTVKR